MSQPERRETVDGNELVFGTNYLGHFVLVASLYPLLARTAGSRIVTVGSAAARLAELDFDDLQAVRPPYKGFRTYGRSKLAQMVLACELDRRLRGIGSPVTSILAHPGGALDGLTLAAAASYPYGHQLSPGPAQGPRGAEQGARGVARGACRARSARRGRAVVGAPFPAWPGAASEREAFAKMTDPRVGGRLWSATERAAGVEWPLGDEG